MHETITQPSNAACWLRRIALYAALLVLLVVSGCSGPAASVGKYPLHTGIVATTFWVGEVFDPSAADGSQVYSTYDKDWQGSYGGCDGVLTPTCSTEPRVAANGYQPSSMVPLENPFYLDLPYDDVNDPTAFAERAAVVPWANDPGYAGQATNSDFSYLKNRWVRIVKDRQVCYGQVEDAGPGQYHDKAYVFGSHDARPTNKKFNGAGMDVSPAINGCLAFDELDGQDDIVSWQFVEASDVPDGPWKAIVTTSQVNN